MPYWNRQRRDTRVARSSGDVQRLAVVYLQMNRVSPFIDCLPIQMILMQMHLCKLSSHTGANVGYEQRIMTDVVGLEETMRMIYEYVAVISLGLPEITFNFKGKKVPQTYDFTLVTGKGVRYSGLPSNDTKGIGIDRYI